MAHVAKKDVKSLWLEFNQNRSESLRNQLTEHYYPLVKRTAQRIHAKLPREVELDDLVSAGTFGLMFAIDAFDMNRAVKFETYCATRIRGAILDELRSWDWVPRLARLRAHKLVDGTRELKLQLGRDPTNDELAQHLNVPMEELDRIARDGMVTRVMSLSRQVRGGESDEERDLFILQDHNIDLRLRTMEREDVKEVLTHGLSRAEQLIIMLYYFEGMTMKEIGATLDLSESRVSQMHSTILGRIQKELGMPQIPPAAAA
ncbi:MAG TPA: FliA/WhiG family RNA polymerase sigma factor [Tepidisphaeraceae bacterium]|jgi:RNA polymerase sigma factor for flagellar operon FliA|nr:FliA/WhiG family RNA polymerase sigma factor [Tepidisphaeraceae bacterium]